jgi:hypothetical protein
MKRDWKSPLFILGFIILFMVANYSECSSQMVIFTGGLKVKGGISYKRSNKNLITFLGKMSEERLQEYADRDYLTKKGNVYELLVAEYEEYASNVMCQLTLDSTLKWLGGKKYIGWIGEFTVDPIRVIHYTLKITPEKKEKKIKNKIEKGSKLERPNSGSGELSESLYKGKKGYTIPFDKRKKKVTVAESIKKAKVKR